MDEMKQEMETEKKEKQQIQADMAALREQYERDLASIDQQAKFVMSPGQQQGKYGVICYEICTERCFSLS